MTVPNVRPSAADVDTVSMDELEAANDILERETIIAKLAAQARDNQSTSTTTRSFSTYDTGYEAGYRDALSRLWSLRRFRLS